MTRHGTARQQGLKKQLKKLKAAYEAASATRKLSQHEHPRTLSWEASPLQPSTARGRGPVVADSGGGGGGGGGGRSGGGAINSTASLASLTGATGARSSSWRLAMASSYSLVVGEDVDELEEKFKATLDSEVYLYVLCTWCTIYIASCIH